MNASPEATRPGDEILVCECGRPDCSARLEVPRDVFEIVRNDGRHFLVAPGHEEPTAEEVVIDAPSYLVISSCSASSRG